MNTELKREVEELREALRAKEEALAHQQDLEQKKQQDEYNQRRQQRRAAYMRATGGKDLPKEGIYIRDLDLERLPSVVNSNYIECDLNDLKSHLRDLPEDKILRVTFHEDGGFDVWMSPKDMTLAYTGSGLMFSKTDGKIQFQTFEGAQLIPSGEKVSLVSNQPYPIDMEKLPNLEIGSEDTYVKLSDYKQDVAQLKPGERLVFGRAPTGEKAIKLKHRRSKEKTRDELAGLSMSGEERELRELMPNDVSRSHFYIENQDGKFVLVDTSSNGTRMIPQVEDSRISTKTRAPATTIVRKSKADVQRDLSKIGKQQATTNDTGPDLNTKLRTCAEAPLSRGQDLDTDMDTNKRKVGGFVKSIRRLMRGGK